MTPSDQAKRPSRERSGFVLCAGIRTLEANALSVNPPMTLMRAAAASVADECERRLRRLPSGSHVIGAIGPGNNGGDALLALIMLARRGYRVSAAIDESMGAGADGTDAHEAYREWLATNGESIALQEIVRHVNTDPPPLLIDGLFGIGLSRPLGGASARFADLTRRYSGEVIAIDVPSGLNADCGSLVGGPLASAVRADRTVTMIADKAGLHTGQGRAHAGVVKIANLGIAVSAHDGLRVDRSWARARLSSRSPVAHKGSFGTTLIVGGARSMPGAALLAAMGARAIGAGRVATLSPDGPVFSPNAPQIMAWHAETPSDFGALMGQASSLAIGCGLGVGAVARSLLGRALELEKPLCVDADALNIIADPAQSGRWTEALRQRAGRSITVMTPHPLEAARLLNCDVRDIEADRIQSALEIARRFEAIVLLKGAGSILASPDARWGILSGGTAALATGGTGDILAGMVAGRLGQHDTGWDATGLAGVLHGEAAMQWQSRHPRGIGMALEELINAVVDAVNAL